MTHLLLPRTVSDHAPFVNTYRTAEKCHTPLDFPPKMIHTI